jgi:hypothetical protein
MFLLAGAFCACCLTLNGFGAEPERQEIEVTARGVGADADAALKDALSQAVLQAAGAFVDSETLVKNDEIVHDKVLTCSDGIVKRFEKLQEPQQDRQGFWTVKIKAVVQQKILKRKLAEAKLITVKVDNAQDFWAETITAAKRREDAIPLIEKALNKIDICAYVQLTVADRRGNRGEKAQPEFQELGNGRVSVAVPVVVQIDFKRFQEETAQPLAEALDYLCLAKEERLRTYTYDTGTTEIEIPYEANRWRKYFFPSRSERDPQAFGPGKLPAFRTLQTFRFEPGSSGSGGRGNMQLLLNVSRRCNPESQNFVCYTLPSDLQGYKGIFYDKDRVSKRSMLKLSLLDKSGAEITTSQTPLGKNLIFNSRHMWISPELELENGQLSVGKVVLLAAEVSADDVKDIASVQVVLVPAGNDGAMDRRFKSRSRGRMAK